ncbi:caspase family protein [Spirulina sp. CCNP1310]|uniref:caspase family protein n=1 Tax=Spirulina sp. CCNP1310 TaxID=3110249 RepID=UPI002B219AD9|nr:caspase family protein [Spirulina sp. CCNP1310]MEA5418361.1 caspase family protein [Spirulina sp. CCNP1310]
MGLDRRTFLQRVGLALLTTGTGAIAPSPSWAASATEYQQTLTAAGPRKLALLVGINHYPHHPALEGCVTDVELQRDLLIHRFGFVPADIITLTDQQGTRENIETAFSEHLIKQAKTGDQVLFHFSGYGAQVHGPGDQPMLINRLVSVDRETAETAETTEGVGNGILEETLLLLLRSLPTTQALVVLDTAYQSFGQLLQGSWRSRSHPDAPAASPNPAELVVVDQLRQRLGRARFKANLPLNWQQWPGLLLGSDGALEGRWSGMTAGLLTYSLTQWLWAHTPAPTLWFTLEHLSETLTPAAAQEPYIKGKVQGDRPLFNTNPAQPTGIEGYIATVAENTNEIQLQLGGMNPWIWSHSQGRSQFRVTGTEQVLEVRSRSGLTAKAIALGQTPLQPGQGVEEWLRVFPRNLGLTIALDPQLQRIERVDATSALANIGSVSNVVLAGEQATDYLLSRTGSIVPVAIATTQQQEIAQGYELFSAGGVPVPNTVGSSEEAVKLAVNRFVPTLTTLLAAKWWQLLSNGESSQLPIQVSLSQIQTEPKLLAQYRTRRAQTLTQPPPILTSPGLLSLPLGTMVQYQVENWGDDPIHMLVVGLDSRNRAIALYPPVTGDRSHWVIEPQTVLTLPAPTSSLTGIMAGSPGLNRLYVICSRAPFPATRKHLAQQPQPKGEGDRFMELANPLRLTQALLQDLHAASQPLAKGDSSDHYEFHVAAWAAMPLIYAVG